MYRIDWKRLALFAGAVTLAILLIRGCVYAQRRGNRAANAGTDERGGRQFVLRVDADGAVREMALDDYLFGVVAAEMPAAYEEEALKAQAVAARTYTLYRMEHGGCARTGADVCTDSGCCQSYADADELRRRWGENGALYEDKLKSAIRATEGEVLLYGGELPETLYHAASGGVTEDSENVFAAARGYLRSVESANESGSAHLTDTFSFTREEFAAALNRAFPGAKLTAAALEKDVEVLSRFTSGRVDAVRLGRVRATGRQVRAALGLSSAWFTLEFRKNGVKVSTRGYGHGVGLSQAGANGMAQAGASYAEILAHYYTGTTLTSLDRLT